MTSQNCPREKENEANCPCPKTECDNHGKCCVCVAAHRQYGKPVFCMTVLASKS